MDLYETAITMLESAIYNMEDAQRKLEVAGSNNNENIEPPNMKNQIPPRPLSAVGPMKVNSG